MGTREPKFDVVPDSERQSEAVPLDIKRATGLSEASLQAVEQIKQNLFDPHIISRKHDQEGRETKVLEIARKR